jgi:tetratricopeptide (TPR) repeat protein
LNSCSNKDIGIKIELYFLDLLSEEELAEFEEHLIMCDYCANEVDQFNAESIQLLTSEDIKKEIKEIIREKEDTTVTTQVSEIRFSWKNKISNWRYIAAAAIIILIATLLPWKLKLEFGDKVIAEDKRTVILPFGNKSDNPELDWMGTAISRLLSVKLDDSRQLYVVPEQDIQAIINYMQIDSKEELDQTSTIKVAENAKARWLLNGTIIRGEPKLSVVTSIIEVKAQDTIATHLYTQNSGQDFFSFVDSIGLDILNDTDPYIIRSQYYGHRVADKTTSSLDAYKYYVNGVDKYNEYRFNEAQKNFEKALEYDSTMAMAFYYISKIQNINMLSYGSTISKALSYLDKVSYKEKYYIRSFNALALGDTANAISQLLELCSEYPDESEAYFQLATLEAFRFNYLESNKYAKLATEKNPFNKVAVNHLAYGYQLIGEYDKALEAIEQYIKLAPDEPNPYDTKAEIMALQGRFKEAINTYTKALEIDKDFSSSRINKVYLLLLDEQFTSVQPEIQYLLNSKDPKSRSWGRTLEVAVLIRQGKFKQALSMIPEGIKLDIEDNQNISYLMKLFLQAHLIVLLESSETIIKSINSMKLQYDLALPDSKLSSLTFQGYLLAKSGNLSEAEQLAEDVKNSIEGDAGITGSNFITAFVMLYRENWTQARELFEGELEKYHSYVLEVGLAQALLGEKKSKEAIEKIESLLKSFEWKRALWGMVDIKLYYYLGQAYEQSGEIELAKENYQHFLFHWKEADVELPELKDARERLDKLN